MDMDLSLAAILEVTPYGREEDLKEELRKLHGQKTGSGTKIELYRLKWYLKPV